MIPSRQILRLTLALSAALLIGLATWMFLTRPAQTTGDVQAIEAGLSPGRAESVAPVIPPPNPIPTVPQEPAVVPPNAVSRLDQLGESLQAAPTSLRIESLDVDAPVNPYGINERTGLMAVPRNVEEVAWYQYGPVPGEQGSSVLAAHVDLAGRGPGVFYRLRDLEPGQTVVVGYSDGSEQAFEVVGRTTYAKEDLPLDVVFSRKGKAVLTLITCGGGFDPDDQRYDSNVVVYAVPVGAPGSDAPPLTY